MGLFSKFGHGGVKVQVQAPSSIAADQVIPVAVNISSDELHTVNGVKVELQAQAREQGLGMIGTGQRGFGGVGVEDERTAYQTVAQVESREPLSVGPGQTQTVNLQLLMNGSTGTTSQLGGTENGGLGGALRAVVNFAGNLDHINYIYRVNAIVEVEGVTLHPNDNQAIQILPAQNTQQPMQPTINNFQASQPEVTQPPIQQSPVEQPPTSPTQNNETPQV